MARRYIVFFVACFVLFGTMGVLLITEAERDYQLRGYVDATQSADLPFRVPRLGVNVDLFQYTSDELHQQFALMQAAQVTWVRQFAYWDHLQPVPERFTWSQWDQVMDVFADYSDLQMVVVFMNSPDWSRNQLISAAPPDDPTDFANFAQNFAERYGEQVDYYQIWDEPNLSDAWGQRDPQPTEYAALLAAGYTAIHDADPTATVLLAGLAPTTEREGQNIADSLYLDALYQIGAAPYFDAVAAKPYGFNLSSLERTVDLDTLNFSRIVAMREVMVANGDGRKPLWASNWGWNALPDNWSGRASIWGAVSERQRIDYTLSGLDRVEHEWPWLGGLILHHWQPDEPLDDPQWGFAIINQDNQPTALYDALAMRSLPSSASNGLYDPRTLYARYSGLWTFGELGADIGWLEPSDSQLEFDFHGRHIGLLLREGDYFAFLYPFIGEEPANATPRDVEGNAYVLLRSDTAEPEKNIVPIARNLPDEQHTLRIVTDFGRDQWALLGYAVSSRDLAQPYRQQLSIARINVLIAVVLFVGAALRLSWRPLYEKSESIVGAMSYLAQMIISLLTSIAMMLGLLLTFGSPVPDVIRREAFQWSGAVLLSGGMLAFNPALWAILICLLLLFILIYHRIEVGLVLTLLWAPFFLFPVELYIFSFPMVELLLLLTFTAFALRKMVEWGQRRQTLITSYPIQWRIRLNTVDYALLAWGLFACLSLIWTQRLDPALTELRTLFVEPLLFYIMLRNVPNKTTLMRQLVIALLASATLVCVIGIVLFIGGEGVITAESGTRRLASVYGSPNNVGLLLGRCVPFALALLLYSDKRTEQALLIGVLGVMGITALLTQSVGALLFGIPTGVAIVVIWRLKWRALPILLILVGLGAVGLVIGVNLSPRFASLLDLSTGTNFIRIRVWQSSLAILADNPVTGLGLDQFLYAFRGQYIMPDAIFDPDLSHPHNIVLDFWIRLGIGGLGVLIALLFAFGRSVFKSTVNHNTPSYRPLLVGATGAMFALLAHGLIDNSIYVIDLSVIFILIMAIAANGQNLSRGSNY